MDYLIAIVLTCVTTSIMSAITALKKGYSWKKYALIGLIAPLVGVIFPILLKSKIKEAPKKVALKEDVVKPVVEDTKETKVVYDDAEDFDVEHHTEKNVQLKKEIQDKYYESNNGIVLDDSEQLRDFIKGPWLYENPNNKSIFQVFCFLDDKLFVDASFEKFTMKARPISYIVTLMGYYFKMSGNPQKISFKSEKEMMVGNRKLIKLSEQEYKSLKAVLHSPNENNNKESNYHSVASGAKSKRASLKLTKSASDDINDQEAA